MLQSNNTKKYTQNKELICNQIRSWWYNAYIHTHRQTHTRIPGTHSPFHMHHINFNEISVYRYPHKYIFKNLTAIMIVWYHQNRQSNSNLFSINKTKATIKTKFSFPPNLLTNFVSARQSKRKLNADRAKAKKKQKKNQKWIA